MAKSFYDLEIYKEGLRLLIMIYRLVKKYPNEEKFDLTSQTKRSANSIIANIAEAHGRYFYADKVRVMYQSRGEVDEVRSHLMVAKELEFISEVEHSELDKAYENLSKRISAYISYFQNEKEKKSSNLKSQIHKS